MDIFLRILTWNILPVFILITVGYMIDRKFGLNVGTLTKINLYIFVPAFTFANLYTTTLPAQMGMVFAVILSLLAINWIIGQAIGRVRKYDGPMRGAFTNTIMLYNSGNTGIPVITLVFSTAPFLIDGQTPYLDLALTVQIMVLVVQNVSTNTWGVFNANHASGVKGAFLKALSMPALYFVALALIMKQVPWDMTTAFFWPAITYAKNGLISIALVTLGVQLSQTKLKVQDMRVYLAVVLRNLASPLIAAGLVVLFGLDGVIAQVLMISSAMPTAVNTALISIEFDNHPEFATQSVMVSTLLCPVTLTVVIWAARMMFPIV